MTRFLPFLLVLACSSGEGSSAEALADYDADLAAIDQLVGEHAAAVESAADLDAVAALEATYATEWSMLHDQLSAHMETLEGCGMDDDDMGMMDDAMMSIDDMDAEVGGHMSGHDGHADVAECRTDEDSHMDAMAAYMDAMMGYSADWSDSTMCGEGGGGMGGM